VFLGYAKGLGLTGGVEAFPVSSTAMLGSGPNYTFVRIHQTLKITPAMAAGVTSQLWEMSDMVNVSEAWEASAIS
jgi:hypothetical protein